MTARKSTSLSLGSFSLRRLRLWAARLVGATALAVCILHAVSATAASNRCPASETTLDASQQAEKLRIFALWKMLHGPGLDGGDGPLGCPIGDTQEFVDAAYVFKGVGQQFQRGWIFVSHANVPSSEIALVRGLDIWTVWTKGVDGVLRNMAAPNEDNIPTSTRSAVAPFDGTVSTFTRTDGYFALFRCDVPTQTQPHSTECVSVIPVLKVTNGPFDFATRLDINLLASPNRGARELRTDAALSDWLPCFTREPSVDNKAGEDTVVHASVMLRRETGCPLTGVVPRNAVKAWLTTLALPDGELPGTSLDKVDVDVLGTICNERVGELDVLLMQLISLRFRFEAELSGPPMAGIDAAIAPWGGEPRIAPYVIPNGYCAGRWIIETENHLLLQESARYFINVVKRQPNVTNRDWLVKFMQQLVRRDFYEFNALPYTRYQTKALYALSDFAPDESVRVAARGVLDWLFTKLAVSGNLDRDNRPYRRRPDASILGDKKWWSSAANPITVAASLFIGPVQHANDNLDLQLDSEAGKKAMLDLLTYPDLGAVSDYFAASLLDAANSRYELPEALVGWFERRFTNEESNRLTYLQAIRHHSAVADDSALFLQENSGVEIVSGNRNWTIIGGGSYARPGYLPTPPSADGVIIEAMTDTYAEKKQLDGLWKDQPGVLRETMLITSPVAISRQQTLRFGGSAPSARDRNGQENRLCVAEGFMCGFDLRMPDRPFPSKDALDCPPFEPLPAALVSAFQKYAGAERSVTERLGCQVKRKGLSSFHSWEIWTFERGMLALPLPATPDAFMGAWIEHRDGDQRARLRVVWNSSWNADWFRAHAYARSVDAQGGEPPGGWIEPLAVVGDAGDRTKDNHGDVTYDLANVTTPMTWDVLIVGCQKEYALGVLVGHDCKDDGLPKLTVSVGNEPAQPFSCKIHPPPPPNLSDLTHMVPPHEGIVLEVGSCSDGPYGLFVYYWTESCPPLQLSFVSQNFGSSCPFNASDFGFVVVAPSRGWTADDFRAKVEASMNRWRASGNVYKPTMPASIDVPMSPRVVRSGNTWVPAPGAVSSQHTVTFQWTPTNEGSTVTGDSGAPGLFGPSGLTRDPDQWPTALGHVSAPDVPGAGAPLLVNAGTGCFTVAGLPMPGDPDPVGLFVDLRNAAAPVIAEPRTSDLAVRCP